jgi:hypothetical protein
MVRAESVWLPSCPSHTITSSAPPARKPSTAALNLAGELLTHLVFFGVSLFLSADASDALCIGNHQDFGLWPRRTAHAQNEREFQAHRYRIYYHNCGHGQQRFETA